MSDDPATGPCSTRECQRSDTEPCGYVDRHGVTCPTRWCPSHITRYGGVGYCRRHATTLAALTTPFNEPPPLPAVDNRAASLLHWMASLLEDPVRELLNSRRTSITEDLTSDYTGAAAPPDEPEASNRTWTRRWRVVEHESGQAIITVALSVSEVDDDRVLVEVNGQEIHHARPPWIAARRKPATDPVTGSRKRREYLEAIVAELVAALDTVRPAHMI